MAFKPTEEQLKVVAAAKSGKDLVVQALAGTGKTTTLKFLAEALYPAKGTYVAFNKAIVDEAVAKFPTNVTCRTAHSLAFRAVGFEFKDRLSQHARVTLKQTGEWLGVAKIGYREKKESRILEIPEVADLVLTSLSNFCKSVDREISQKHIELPLAARFDKKLERAFVQELLPFLKKAWDDIQDPEGFLKFNHDYYLKIWQLSSPKISGSFVLFDEAQDADPVMLSIIESQKNLQKIYCGDQFQSIYEWRGAENALSKVRVDESLWLTQSFRFGNTIAAEANDILEYLDAPVRVKGLESNTSKVEPVSNPDAILCRTNAGVIQQVMLEQLKKRKVAIVGRTQELIDFAKACGQLQRGQRTMHHELAPFRTWTEAKSYVIQYPLETQEIKTMIDLVDRFGVESLVNALNAVVDEDKSDVVVSTAHKAKGREWDSVKLAGDYLHPSEMETEDLRLAYVSVTRAKRRLDMSEWALIVPRNLESSLSQPDAEFEAEIEDILEESQPPRKGMKWTYIEDLDLVNACISGKSFLEIARTSGRSTSALEARMAKWYLVAIFGEEANDFKSVRFEDEVWDEGKQNELMKLWEEDIELAELAERLDLSIPRLAFEIVSEDLIEFDEVFEEAVEMYYGK
jgi:superfamily I DNA/RNA helicase